MSRSDVICEGNSCRKLRPGEKRPPITKPDSPKARARGLVLRGPSYKMLAMLNVEEDLQMLVKAAQARKTNIGKRLALEELVVLKKLTDYVAQMIQFQKETLSKGTTR